MPDAPDLVTVPNPEEQKGFAVLPRRWVVERFLGWLGCCWRLAKDYERRLENSLAWLQLAFVRILVRHRRRAETLDKKPTMLIMQGVESALTGLGPERTLRPMRGHNWPCESLCIRVLALRAAAPGRHNRRSRTLGHFRICLFTPPCGGVRSASPSGCSPG